MAGASLLTLLDDIATLLDDVAVMSKIAARKTAGVLGDDLAVNAEQVSGVAAERELPVVWKVAKGSLVNKCILVPAALAISAIAPWLITPLLMLGGCYLCYEGFEKVHKWLFPHPAAAGPAKTNPQTEEPEAFERRKVRGAIRTDFVLSAEIIVITLGIVANHPLATQFLTLSLIALVMTLGVYGLVAGIVKMDDVGLFLLKRRGPGSHIRLGRLLGLMLLRTAPKMMKGLTVVGTLAMFLVGGGIISHSIHIVQHTFTNLATVAGTLPYLGLVLQAMLPPLANGLLGLIAGGLIYLLLDLRRFLPSRSRQ